MNLRAMLPLITKLPAESARRAMRALLAADADGGTAAPRVLGAIARGAPGPPSLANFADRARTAFEKDMQPVVSALAGALHANDLNALKGLQALLPGLLREVNRAPALAELLALQLGTAFLDGLKMKETE